MWIGLDEEEAMKEDSMTSDEFFTIITSLINIAKELQVPLERWRTVHNLFILKEANNYNITRLRPLHKIEAELNLIRREVITRRLLRQAERVKYLDDNSYGGRNGRSAMDAVLKKFLTLQAMHLARSNGALTDCDAKACYDRVIPLVLYLSYSKAGLPHAACVWLCKSLTQMKYHVTTAHGISDNCSMSTPERTLYGVGQGATDAPTGWLFISTILSQTQDDLGQGCTIADPTSTKTVTWTHVIFVDDTYLIHSLADPEATPTQIATVVEKDVNLWNKGIYTSGGKLEATKTKYYIIYWRFRPNGDPYIDSSVTNGKQVFLDAGDGPVCLQRIRHDVDDKQFKSLGTRIPGTLEDKYEFENALRTVNKFRKFLLACPLTPRETWTAYKQYLLPSLLYGAAVMSFDDAQIDALHKRITPRLLQKLGIKSTLPREVAFAPRCSGGVGLVDIGVAIWQAKITGIIKHVRANTSIGQLFIIVFRWAQMIAGTRTSILDYTYPIPYMESKWIEHLRKGLHCMKAKLWLREIWEPQPLRHNDVLLMEHFVTQGFSTNQLRILNYCRLYLRVTRLSEITDSPGKTIQRQMWEGNRRHPWPTTRYPVQHKPYKEVWNLWRQGLQSLCTYKRTLRRRLGKWYPVVRHHYPWGYDAETKTAVNTAGKTFTRYKLSTKRSEAQVLMPMEYGNASDLTTTIIPIVDVTILTERKFVQPDTRDFNRHTPTLTWTQTQSAMAMDWETYMPAATQPRVPPSGIAAQLASTLWIVTDGGVKDSMGYYGWVIATDTSVLYESNGCVPGNGEEMDSCRAESVGLLEAVKFAVYLHGANSTMSAPQLQHFCDNITVTNRMQTFLQYKNWYPNQTLRPHMDVMLQICYYLDKLMPQWRTTHVKGHQDDEMEIACLSWEAQLNVRADALATEAKDKIDSYVPPEGIYMHSNAMLFIDGKMRTKHYAKAIQRASTTGNLRQYLEKKFQWEPGVCDDIDWFAFKQGFQRLTMIQQFWATKFVHKWLPLLGESHSQSSVQQCPLCKRTNETWNHFIECTHNEITLDDVANEVLHFISGQNVDPYLRTLLKHALTNKLMTKRSLENINFPFQTYKRLIMSQQRIGWKFVHQGRLSLEWDRHQRRYLAAIGETEVGGEPAWIQRLIYKVLDSHHQRWKQRCDELHNDSTLQQHTKDLLFKRIQGLYTYKDKLLLQDRECFREDLDKWKTAKTSDLKSWITTHENHIRMCATMARKQVLQYSSDLRSHGFSGQSNQQLIAVRPRRGMSTPPVQRITQFVTRTIHPRTVRTNSLTVTPQNNIVPIQTVIEKFFRPRNEAMMSNPRLTPKTQEDLISPLNSNEKCPLESNNNSEGNTRRGITRTVACGRHRTNDTIASSMESPM